MIKTIQLNQKIVSYTLNISTQAKHLRFAIYPDGRFVVSAPKRMDSKQVDGCLVRKSAWILKKLEWAKTHPPQVYDAEKSKAHFLEYKAKALKLAKIKIAHFNQFYQFAFKNITVRNQKTRWGSCSKKGNLNFNYKIALLPETLADYLVVHELCHLGAFNHSKKFWNLVAKTIPNYLQIRKELRQNKLRFL